MNQTFRKVMAVAVTVVFLSLWVNDALSQEARKAEAVKTIFDYRDELKLSDDQVKKIRENLSALDKEVRVLRAKLTLVEVDLENLLEKEGDMAQIKSKVKEVFDIQASIRIADIETSRKINAVMTPAQLKKWREIQAAAR